MHDLSIVERIFHQAEHRAFKGMLISLVSADEIREHEERMRIDRLVFRLKSMDEILEVGKEIEVVFRNTTTGENSTKIVNSERG